MARSRNDSDEAYVIDLCDEVLGLRALRQHRFDYLRGDSRDHRRGRTLPVDAYYESLALVVEYRERQHTEGVAFFDKVNRLTVSGVHRGRQRAVYEQRRREILPQRGLIMVEVSFSDFAHDGRRRLLRRRSDDVLVLHRILGRWVPAPTV